MIDENEPKEAIVDEAIDQAIDSKLDEIEAGASTPQDSSPEKTETGEEDSGGTEPLKTDTESGESEDDLPKGFADHPKWKKLMSDRNEARKAREDAEAQIRQNEDLLNDPEIYRKSLVRRGFSEYEINQKMGDRGFPNEAQTTTPMFERVAKNLGWDVSRLNQSQRDQINDIIRVSEATAIEIVSERLKPIQESLSQGQARTQVDSEFAQVQELAKKEGVDWKVAEKAMEATLIQLDKEAGKKVRIGPMQLYKDATRSILLERQTTSTSKETRDVKKAQSRPLAPTAQGSKAPEKVTARTNEEFDAMVDKYLDTAGYKE